jgi:arsenate reductase-like glutaredoxin family protein
MALASQLRTGVTLTTIICAIKNCATTKMACAWLDRYGAACNFYDCKTDDEAG